MGNILLTNYNVGTFVNAALKQDTPSGQQILAATDYISPNRLIAEFSDVIGKPATYTQVPSDTFKSFLPAPVAQEMLENMLLLEEPGYYGGADLSKSLAQLDTKPTTWKAFVEANKEKWLSK